MATLTVIVTAYNDAEGLKYTLEGLCEQTSEDFDVVIIDNGSTDDTVDVINEYCKEYVGFESFRIDHVLVPEARNEGVKKAKGELVWFVDASDYLAPESVEKLLAATEEIKADIYIPRYYCAGENEPYYDQWVDQLAIAPKIDRFDRALLYTLDYDGRVYRKKFFDLYSLYYPAVPKYYNTILTTKCLFGCDAKVTGVAGAIYSHRKGVYENGFDEKAEPSLEMIKLAISTFDPLFDDIKALVEDETGSLDGDEYTVQEFLSIYFETLTNDYYRYFWYLDDECLTLLHEKFEELSSFMTDERKQKVNDTFKDLRFPGMYIRTDDAVKTPMFSLIAEFSASEDLDEFFRTLYIQKFPFFEIFVKESVFNSPEFPEKVKEYKNIHALPDKNYFTLARGNASGIPINVKDSAPLDPRILSELSLSKAPKLTLQYMFAAKRKQYSAKTYLKKKGIAMK